MKKTIATTLALLLFTTHSAADMAEGIKAYEQGDYAKALNEFTIEARRGNPAAQNNLGVMYAIGEIVKRDLRTAAKWYEKAAEQGLALAQYNLGVLYEEGLGVVQDIPTAAVWFRLASEQGDVLAQHRLGLLLAKGVGIKRDNGEAYFWLSLVAGATTDEILRTEALDIRLEVEKRMSQKEVVDAELLVGNWRKKTDF